MMPVQSKARGLKYNEPREKRAAPQVAFVFRKPLTNESSASADSRARQRGVHESEFKPAGFGKFIPVSAGFLLSKTVQTSRDPTENATTNA